MIKQPSRRELIKYGIGLGAWTKISRGQIFPGPGVKSYASAGIALVTGNLVTSGNATSSAVNASAANFAVMAVSNGLAGDGSISDNNSNTWTKLSGPGSNPDSVLYYAVNFAGLASHTFTVSGATFPGFCVLTFSGLTTSTPFDQQSGSFQAAATSVHPGALTPSAANSLLVSSVSYTTSIVTADNLGAGFTQSGTQSLVGGTSYGVGIAYKIQSGGPSAEDPVWSFSGLDVLGSKLAIFK